MFKNLFGGKGGNENDLFQPRMPEVDIVANIEEVFDKARKSASGEMSVPGSDPKGRFVIVITPGRMLMNKPCPPAGSISQSQVASIEGMMPSSTKRNIAVIAYNELKAVTKDASKTIPFLGMLMGFAYIGHAVWIFEGHSSALAAGCRNADLLLVDSGMVPHLPNNWINTASSVMRHKEIYVHDRGTFKLGPVKAD
jgi:hypothetical protein